MGWLEALVTLVRALIWPGVVVFAVVILRKELAALVGRLSKVTAPGVGIEFGAEVAATAQIAEAELPNPAEQLPRPLAQRPGVDAEPLPEYSTLEALRLEAARHPVGAVVRAWLLIEFVARDADPKRFPGTGTLDTIRRLSWEGRLSDEMHAVAHRLSDMRGRVVHGRDNPTIAEADEYVSAAWRLAVAITEAEA
jgi:hypothetical protein